MARDDDVRSLLGAWAVDAVDDVDRARVERAIRSDPAMAREARDLKETAARLAEADAADPPRRLRAAVLAEIEVVDQDRRPVARERRPGRLRFALAAAAAAVAIAVPTVVAIQQTERATVAEQQVASLQESLSQPGAQLVRATGPDGGRVVAVLGGTDAVFSAEEMPSPGDDVYQLWVVGEDGVSSAGVLTWQQGRLLAQVPDTPDGAGLALTIEPAGGSDQPTTDPVVILGL